MLVSAKEMLNNFKSITILTSSFEDWYKLFKYMGWKRSATLIWVKQNASMGWQDYRSQHECISYGWKEGADHYFTKDRSQTTMSSPAQGLGLPRRH